MTKVETQQHEVETLEVEDDSSKSSILQNSDNRQNKKEFNSVLRSSKANEQQQRTNAIRAMDTDRKMNDELRYQEPDS